MTWFRRGVIYEIYPRSFQDSDGDGVGDLRGIASRLPYLRELGVDGIWALEHHPMKFLYGYSVAAELRPATRYDQVAEALGCHAELVSEPAELRPALERAFESGKPALVNVLTDPEVVYPRKAVLA